MVTRAPHATRSRSQRENRSSPKSCCVHADSSGAPPIRLEPPVGSWSTRVKIVVAAAGGAPAAPWPFVIAGKPSGGAITLQPDAVTTLVLRLDSLATAALAPGMYQLAARLDLADGRGWRGVVESEAIEVEVSASTEAPVARRSGTGNSFASATRCSWATYHARKPPRMKR